MKDKLKSKIAIIAVAALVVAIGAYMILNARSSYSYEDIADSIQVETASNGDACMKALIAKKDKGVRITTKILEVDEVNKIEYYSAYIYVSSSVGARCFGESDVQPICLVREDGLYFDTSFFEGQYDKNGMPVPIDSFSYHEREDVEYKQYVREVYYAEFVSDGLERSFKTTPRLIWSKD